jgi:hypothetical protein
VRPKSLRRERRWALIWSYVFLVLFAVIFLTPPLYMLITSLKTSAEISAATNPWWVFHPTFSNYVELLTSNQFLTFFRNSAFVSIFVVTITMLISVPAAFALSSPLTAMVSGHPAPSSRAGYCNPAAKTRPPAQAALRRPGVHLGYPKEGPGANRSVSDRVRTFECKACFIAMMKQASRTRNYLPIAVCTILAPNATLAT